MVEAKLLRKKLKNGLIVDKWDLVTIIEKQQAEIANLKAGLLSHRDIYPAELTDEEILDFINAFCLDMGDYWELTEKNATPMIKAILRKAQEND